ncbi:MAG: hypothetical protein OEV79_11145 [candidate division WOR-3 bacterium]|nr:hypothetical protein [candidate division WOR-3 bacterium]
MLCITVVAVIKLTIFSSLAMASGVEPAIAASTQQIDTVHAESTFKLLHTASKDNYEAWTSNVWGTVGFLIIVLGWILSSKNARLFLSRKHRARMVAIITVGIIAAINMVLNVDLARQSTDIQETLAQSAYATTMGLEEKHYARYHVSYCRAILSDIIVGSMFVLIVYLLMSLKKLEDPESTA